MNYLVKVLARSRLLKGDLDLHLVRGSMVLIFLLFGYQKWWEYEVQTLTRFISYGPLTSWMYPAFGLHGASYFLGVSEWLTAALLIWGSGIRRRASSGPSSPSARSSRRSPSSRS